MIGFCLHIGQVVNHLWFRPRRHIHYKPLTGLCVEICRFRHHVDMKHYPKDNTMVYNFFPELMHKRLSSVLEGERQDGTKFTNQKQGKQIKRRRQKAKLTQTKKITTKNNKVKRNKTPQLHAVYAGSGDHACYNVQENPQKRRLLPLQVCCNCSFLC